MPLSDIVNVIVSKDTAAPSEAGFSLPLISSFHNFFSQRTKKYTGTDGMITDGFPSDHEAVRAAGKMLSQNPKLPEFLVGREENREPQEIKVWPVLNGSGDPKPNYPYSVELNGFEFIYTSDVSPTVAEITAGFDAALEPAAWIPTNGYDIGDYVKNDTGPVKVYRCTKAGTSAGSGGPTGEGSSIVDGTCEWDYICPEQNVSVTDNGTDFDVIADSADDAFTLDMDLLDLEQENTTPDGSPDGIVEDIVAMRAENDDWYTFIPTNLGKDVLEAITAYMEAQIKFASLGTSDSKCYDETSVDDIMYNSQAAAYVRSQVMYHHAALTEMPHAAWVGKTTPFTPGSVTWKFKTLAGVTFSNLDEGKQDAMKAKNGNMYVRIGGINITQDSKTPGDEWIDVTLAIDFLTVRWQERIFGRLAALNKVPFTDKGTGVIENEVWGVWRLGIREDIIAEDPAPTVTVPLVKDVDSADKKARHLPNVEAEGTLSGAIHSVTLNVTVIA